MGTERDILEELEGVVRSRKTEMPEGSYTTSLFQAGQMGITRKVNEEAFEAIQALEHEGSERVTAEIADLMYHLTVAMTFRGDVNWSDVFEELERRRDQLTNES